MRRPLPLVVGMAAAVATAWWGPGGWGLRAGTRAIARTVTAQRGGQIAVFAACALVALSVLLVLGQGAVPDWTPFTPPRRLAR